MTRARLTSAARVAISVGLLVILFRTEDVDVGQVTAVIRGARPLPLAGALLCYVVLGTLVRGFRWQAIIGGLGHRVPVRRATELFLVGTFFNQLLPTGIGGDIVRTLVLARDGVGRSHAASTVLADRAIGIVLLVLPGAALLPLMSGRASPLVTAVLVAAAAGGVLGLLVLLRAEGWRRLAARVPVLGSAFEHSGLTRFAASFADYSARALAVAGLWSIGFTVLIVTANTLLGRALGIDQAGWLDWALIVPVVALTALLPSVGGWGVREVAYVRLLGALHPPVVASTATALSLLFGGMNLVLAATGGLLAAAGGLGPSGRDAT